MSKAVIISIRPKWCQMIANGEKTVEVRKTRPKLDVPFKCYIYCSMGDLNGYRGHSRYGSENGLLMLGKSEFSQEIMGCDEKRRTYIAYGFCGEGDVKLNGKVIGEFVCDKITGTVPWRIKGKTGFLAKRTEDEASLPQRSCLTMDEIVQYAGSENRCIYGWNISKLVIYDKPKALSEYTGLRETKFGYAPLCITRAPQSWCYVEEV